MTAVLLAMGALVAVILAIGAATRPITRDGDGRLAIFLGCLGAAVVIVLILVCGGNR